MPRGTDKEHPLVMICFRILKANQFTTIVSQADSAAMAGVSGATISRVVAGKRRLSVNSAKRLLAGMIQRRLLSSDEMVEVAQALNLRLQELNPETILIGVVPPHRGNQSLWRLVSILGGDEMSREVYRIAERLDDAEAIVLLKQYRAAKDSVNCLIDMLRKHGFLV